MSTTNHMNTSTTVKKTIRRTYRTLVNNFTKLQMKVMHKPNQENLADLADLADCLF